MALPTSRRNTISTAINPNCFHRPRGIGSTMRHGIHPVKMLIHSATAIALTSFTALAVLFLLQSAATLSPRLTAREMTLVGAEEFTGSCGRPPNPAYWNYDLGGGGWELQTYTSNRDNVGLDGTGLLVIEACRSAVPRTSRPGWSAEARSTCFTDWSRRESRRRGTGAASGGVDDGRQHHHSWVSVVRRDRHHGAGQHPDDLSRRHPRPVASTPNAKWAQGIAVLTTMPG